MATLKQIRCALLALAVVGAAGVAQARDNVYWSLGVEAAPGVTLGVGNARPVVVAPAPVYVAPQPVYVAPQPVYVPPPVVYRPAPVYVAGPAYYGPPGHWKHRHKRWKHHHD